MSITVDSSEFMKKLARWVAASNALVPTMLEKEVETAAKGFLKEAAKLTPPAKHGVSGTAAKKRGESALIADIYKVFAPTDVKKLSEVEFGEIRQIHARHRTRKGRVPKALAKKKRVYAPWLKRYIRERKRDVGKLIAGFEPAADQLGVTLPKWVSEHDEPGGFSLVRRRNGKVGVWVTVSNKSRHAADISNLPHRLARALKYQGNKLERRAKFLLKKAARQARLKTS